VRSRVFLFNQGSRFFSTFILLEAKVLCGVLSPGARTSRKNANIMSAVTRIRASCQHSEDINVLAEQARANFRNDVYIVVDNV